MADRSRFLSEDGKPAKFPRLQEAIIQTRESHDKIKGGCDFCFTARDPDSMKRSSLCKFVSRNSFRIPDQFARLILNIYHMLQMKAFYPENITNFRYRC